MSTIDGDVMSQTVGLPGGSIACERGYRALSNKVCGRVILVQRCEDRSERLARVQLLRWLRIPGVHVNHEVGIRGEEGHLSLGVATVGAVRVALDELPECKTIRGFRRRDGGELAHQRSPQASRMARVSRNA